MTIDSSGSLTSAAGSSSSTAESPAMSSACRWRAVADWPTVIRRHVSDRWGRGSRRDRLGSESVLITRTPLRVSLGGGGTDLPSYYELGRGSWSRPRSTSTSTSGSTGRSPTTTSSSTPLSNVSPVREHRASDHSHGPHAARRSALGRDREPADIPAGTGLGSSGAFTVGMLGAVYAGSGNMSRRWDLAEEALPRDRHPRQARRANRTSTSRRSAGSPASSSRRTGRVESTRSASRPRRARARGEPPDVLHRVFPLGRRGARGPAARTRGGDAT